MLIKGAALNLFGYGDSPYTVSSDIDLVIRSKKSDLSSDLFPRINQLAEGFPLEFDFIGHNDIDMNGALEVDFERIWVDAVPVQYAGRDFYLMCPEDALITACINTCRKWYFNLKALGALDLLLSDQYLIRRNELSSKACAHGVADIVYAGLTTDLEVLWTRLPSDVI